jgi:hypothetical protein
MPSSATLSLWVLARHLALISLDFPLATLVGIIRRRKILTCIREIDTKAKLEQLRSGRLICHDPKDHDLDMQGFKWKKTHNPTRIYFELLLSMLLSMLSWLTWIGLQPMLNMQGNSRKNWLLSCLDYKVVNIILIIHVLVHERIVSSNLLCLRFLLSSGLV